MIRGERNDPSQQPLTVKELQHVGDYPRGQRESENLYIYGKQSFWGMAWPFLIIVLGFVAAIVLEAHGR